MNFTLAPNGLATDAGPAGGFEVRNELGEGALIIGRAGEPTERMGLTGTTTATLGRDLLEIAASHADCGRAPTECAEVEIERTIAVQLAQGTDAIANARGEDPEVGLV